MRERADGDRERDADDTTWKYSTQSRRKVSGVADAVVFSDVSATTNTSLVHAVSALPMRVVAFTCRKWHGTADRRTRVMRTACGPTPRSPSFATSPARAASHAIVNGKLRVATPQKNVCVSPAAHAAHSTAAHFPHSVRSTSSAQHMSHACGSPAATARRWVRSRSPWQSFVTRTLRGRDRTSETDVRPQPKGHFTVTADPPEAVNMAPCSDGCADGDTTALKRSSPASKAAPSSSSSSEAKAATGSPRPGVSCARSLERSMQRRQKTCWHDSTRGSHITSRHTAHSSSSAMQAASASAELPPAGRLLGVGILCWLGRGGGGGGG
eukprot:Rhum_TRINITY_DN14169_c20_g1::Rhum_TRINITY_DN14169_c20_g1_i1::g.72017::m.72017